jgi:hypothetical protein
MGKSVVWNEMKKTLLIIVMAAIIIGCGFSQGELEIADGVIWRLEFNTKLSEWYNKYQE